MNKIVLVILTIIFSLIELEAKNITDMMGRQVKIEDKINKVATVGSIPVINSFIFAVGKGDTIISGLNFAKKNTWKYQQIFQPSLANNIDVQGFSREILIEPMVQLNPQIIFTMDQASVELLERNGFNVVFLKWKDAEDIKQVISLMGEIFDVDKKSEEYVKYFENTIIKITKAIPSSNKPKVLFANLRNLTTPHLIAEWWIKKAGGLSVTDNGRKNEKYPFGQEDVIRWNPDILIVENQKDLKLAYSDVRFSTINAVKNKQVYVSPIVAHKWSNRTSELPLMVIWASNIFHKNIQEKFPIREEMKNFYATFYQYKMTDKEIDDILGIKNVY